MTQIAGAATARDDDDYLSPDEVITRWRGRIKKKTLANWRTRKPKPYGPEFKRIGGRILYLRASVEACERDGSIPRLEDLKTEGKRR